jgi:hypothetical protein
MMETSSREMRSTETASVESAERMNSEAVPLETTSSTTVP